MIPQSDLLKKLNNIAIYLANGHPFEVSLARRELAEVIQLVKSGSPPESSSRENERSV